MAIINGQHLVVDFWDCQKDLVSSKEKLTRILKLAAKESGAVVLGQKVFQFSTQGVSASGGKNSGTTTVVLFEDSHIIAHVNLKNKYIAIDIYTGGAKTDPNKSFAYLKKELKAKRVKFWLMKRGVA